MIYSMTLEEEAKFIDKVNEDFIYFIDVIPFIEIDDNVVGKTHKLRNNLDNDGKYSIGEIFFELQYLLYRFRKQKKIDNCKLIVSKLILSPIIPNSTFRRGFIIKMKYE